MLTDDFTFFLFAVGFISLLNIMIASGLWLSFLTSRKNYLAIACAAAAVEVCRHLGDFVSGLNPGSVALYINSNFLQFTSTILLSISLHFIFKNSFGREIWLLAALYLGFAVATIYDVSNDFPGVPYQTYITSAPLIAATALLFWRALFTGKVISPSKLFFVIASGMLLAIRLWLPNMPLDNVYLLIYYMEYLFFSIMLTAMIIFEIEYSNTTVKKLLNEKVQSEQDLQFIVDNSLDIILVANEVGLLRSWSRKAQEVFGYSREQAIGKIHMDEMFSDNFWKRDLGAVDEFHAHMESIEGKSFMVDVRLKEVSHNNTNYSIFVLRLIAEPGNMLG